MKDMDYLIVILLALCCICFGMYAGAKTQESIDTNDVFVQFCQPQCPKDVKATVIKSGNKYVCFCER